MTLSLPPERVFVPDGRPVEAALAATTHAAIAAHQDDIEIMAYHGIVECFGRPDRAFLGVTVTDGSGSPRDGLYGDYTDEEMREVRRHEQRKAAFVGEYCAQVALDHTSGAVKTAPATDVVTDIASVLEASTPERVYTHSLADKHDTHVAVTLRTLEALRALPPDRRPREVWGCEVWRDLDWMLDEDKTCLDVSARENLAAALVGVFDSQICGGKRYDLATLGRRRANATYFASHGTDATTGLSFAMDLSPLVRDPELDPAEFVAERIRRFEGDVRAKIRDMGRA